MRRFLLARSITIAVEMSTLMADARWILGRETA
jgi:hypothetical protein